MKTVIVKYGGFSAEQLVEENLYNAIYQQGNKDAYFKIENEINYLMNCGMGKKKGLEHLLKICKEEQIKEK